jgi:hypothetical protein
MRMTTHDPDTIFAPVGPYTHGLEVVEARRLLFITGTMGLDESGKAPAGSRGNARWPGATSARSWSMRG